MNDEKMLKNQNLKIISLGLIASSVTYWFGVCVFSLLPSSRFFEYWGSLEWLSFMGLFVPLTIIPCSMIGNFLSDEERSIKLARRFYYILTLCFNCILYWLTYLNRDTSDFYVRMEMGFLFGWVLLFLFLPVILMMVLIANLNRKFVLTLKTKAPLQSMLDLKNLTLFVLVVLYYGVILYFFARYLGIFLYLM